IINVEKAKKIQHKKIEVNSMTVQVSKPNMDTHKRGDPMKCDKTYKFGKTTVHDVAPPKMTDQELEQIEKKIHQTAWEILERIQEKEENNVKSKMCPRS